MFKRFRQYRPLLMRVYKVAWHGVLIFCSFGWGYSRCGGHLFFVACYF
jgi:hypothetical protein